MTVLDKIAPPPRNKQEATAEALARQYTAYAQLHFRLGIDLADRDKASQSISKFTSFYAIAFLLRELEAAGVRVADRVAGDLWEAWQNPHVTGPDVWNWLEEYGIDPEVINKIADEFRAEEESEKD